jgi:hypothetical protein
VHIFPNDEPTEDIGTELQLELEAADPITVEWIQIGLWMMDHAQRLIPARWSDHIHLITDHIPIALNPDQVGYILYRSVGTTRPDRLQIS